MYTLNAWNGFFWLSSFLKLTIGEIKRDMLRQKIHDELIKYLMPSTSMIKEVKINLWGSYKVVIVLQFLPSFRMVDTHPFNDDRKIRVRHRLQ